MTASISSKVYGPWQTDDGGYVFSCTYDGVECGICIAKADPNGSIAWQLKFDRKNQNSCDSAVRQTADGGYILTGGTDGDLYLVKLAPDDIASQFFLRGDSNSDGTVDISDPIRTLEWLFLSGPVPACLDATDADDTGTIDLTDPIYTITFLFDGGVTIPVPYPFPGIDPTPDGFSCKR